MSLRDTQLSARTSLFPILSNVVAVEDSLRPVSTFGPQKMYTEKAYPTLNVTPGAHVRNYPQAPASTRADVRNNNLPK